VRFDPINCIENAVTIFAASGVGHCPTARVPAIGGTLVTV
jgi:hypothetical protein